MLHNQRRKLADRAGREAAGESFWTESFDEPLRTKIVQLIRMLRGHEVFTPEARKMILFDEGIFFLASSTYNSVYDFEQFVLTADDDMIPTAIEAWSQVSNTPFHQSKASAWESGEAFNKLLNTLLQRHRVAFELINGEMIPFSSRELHEEVVTPTLRLLHGDATWSNVEAAYTAALGELSRGEAADAVTDAGTALQEALVVLGCEGNALGPLIKSARAKGLLAAHDSPLLDAIDKAAHWASADRSNTGDAHNASPALVEDAWLTVHVVGALILRLSMGTPRES